MKTLEEIAVMTILKFGIPFREALPAKLIDKIQAIDGTMTGRDNYEFYRSMNSQEFDISWNQGTRTFIQRGLHGDDEYDQKRRFGVSTS